MRSLVKSGHTTDPGHRPDSRQRHLEWSQSRLVRWGGTIGPGTGTLVQRILEGKPHPEQGYRACLGIMRLAVRYGSERLEAAAKRALDCRTVAHRSVKSILDHVSPDESEI